jgi:glycosyltransferase involved in cell wall biosynthesis
VTLTPDLPDLRAEVQRHAVVVLPFVSGGGIKNKLLEAASMSLPIVCTRRALGGLNNPPPGALTTASTPSEWVRALSALWGSDDLRTRSGAAGRAWVRAAHSWEAAVRAPLASLASHAEMGRPS